MFKLSSLLRRCALCVLAAYFLMALEWPTVVQADDKSTKGAAGENKWHPRRLPGFDDDGTTTKQLIVLGVVAGVVVTAAIIGKIVEHANKPKDEKKEAKKKEKAEKETDEQAAVRNFSQPAL